MADINDRLDRLQRRERFDRTGELAGRAAVAPQLPSDLPPDAGAPASSAASAPRPAGVDDRLGEVLDAVAQVVRRHPGLSVMVAVADGQAGRPVIRVSERDGDVETGVVVPGQHAVGGPAPARPSARVVRQQEPAPDEPRERQVPARMSRTAAAYAEAARQAEVDRARAADPARRSDPAPGRQGEPSPQGELVGHGDPVRQGELVRPSDPARQGDAVRQGELVRQGEPAAAVQAGTAPRRTDGRHAAPTDEPAAGSGWTGASWHSSLWSADRSGAGEYPGRFRSADTGPPMAPGHRRPDPARDADLPPHDRLRLVPDPPEPAHQQPTDPQLAKPDRPDLPPPDPRQVAPPDRLQLPPLAAHEQAPTDRQGHRQPAQDAPAQDEAAQRQAAQHQAAQRQAAQQPAQQAAQPSAPPPPGGTIPLPAGTSQVVSRLAQLLRDDPTLASSWGREAPEA